MKSVLSKKRLQLILTGMILLIGQAFAGDLTKTYTFGSGDPVSSSKINTDFDQLFTEINLKETRIDNIEASSWVTSTRINDGAVTSNKLDESAVTSTKIASGAVTAEKLYTGATGAQRVAIDSNDYLVWKLDEAAGATTYVNSGTAASADLSATGTIRAGRVGMFGNALHFINTAGVYASGATAANPDGDSITVSLWVKPSQFYMGNWSNIICKKYTNDSTWSNPYAGIQLVIDGTPGDGTWYAQWNIGGTFDSFTPATLSADKLGLHVWTHIGLTYDGSTVRLYKDGVEIGSKATSGVIDYGAGPWLIGGNTPAVSQAFFATIDDIRVANIVRDAAWFRSVFTQGVQHGF